MSSFSHIDFASSYFVFYIIASLHIQQRPLELIEIVCVKIVHMSMST